MIISAASILGQSTQSDLFLERYTALCSTGVRKGLGYRAVLDVTPLRWLHTSWAAAAHLQLPLETFSNPVSNFSQHHQRTCVECRSGTADFFLAQGSWDSGVILSCEVRPWSAVWPPLVQFATDLKICLVFGLLRTWYESLPFHLWTSNLQKN